MLDRLLSSFIGWPALAAVPAAVFLLLYRRVGRPVVRAAAIVWLCYGLYEYGMKRRILCSGECNIRVDLLLIYPALLVLSVVAGVAAVRGRKT